MRRFSAGRSCCGCGQASCDDISLDGSGDPICSDFEPSSFPSTVELYTSGTFSLVNDTCSDCAGHSWGGTIVLDLFSYNSVQAFYRYQEDAILTGCSPCTVSGRTYENARFYIYYYLLRNTGFTPGFGQWCCEDQLIFSYQEYGATGNVGGLQFAKKRAVKVGSGTVISFSPSDISFTTGSGSGVGTSSRPFCLCTPEWTIDSAQVTL